MSNDTPAPTSRPLSREEIYLLKIGELMLQRGSLSMAVNALLVSSRPASREQTLVLRSLLTDLKRAMDEMNAIQWPEPIDEEKKANATEDAFLDKVLNLPDES